MKHKLLFFLYSNVFWFFSFYYIHYPDSEILMLITFVVNFVFSGYLGTFVVREKHNFENSWFLGLISFCVGIFGIVISIAVF